MKKLSLILSFIILGVSIAVAGTTQAVNQPIGAAVNTDFYASSVCSYVPVSTTNALLQNGPTRMHAIVISSAGSLGSFIDLFDANSTTNPPAAVRMYPTLDGTKTGYWPVELYFSSGAMFMSGGTALPTFSFIYK